MLRRHVHQSFHVLPPFQLGRILITVTVTRFLASPAALATQYILAVADLSMHTIVRPGGLL